MHRETMTRTRKKQKSIVEKRPLSVKVIHNLVASILTYQTITILVNGKETLHSSLTILYDKSIPCEGLLLQQLLKVRDLIPARISYWLAAFTSCRLLRTILIHGPLMKKRSIFPIIRYRIQEILIR